MPQVAQMKTGFTTYSAPTAPEDTAPTGEDIISSAIHSENDIYNVYELATRTTPKPDPNFDIIKTLNDRGLWDRRDDFIGVRSGEEFDQLSAKITREDRDREVLARSGWAGWAAMIASGAVSPTTFIPFIKGGTIAKSLVKGAFSVGAGAAAQEAVLFANQQTRTGEEAVFSIGASTILGGVLGAAAHGLSKTEMDKMAYDMANAPGETAISRPTPFTHEASVSAAAVGEDAGKLSYVPGIDTMAKLSPVTRGIQQGHAPSIIKDAGGSSTLRQVTAAFSQAGLFLEDNKLGKTAAPAGNVENMVATYGMHSYEGALAIDNAYKRYIFGDAQPKVFAGSLSVAKGYLDKGKMDINAFKTEVSRAIWNDFEHGNKHVTDAAIEIDEKVFQPLYKEAVEVGIFTGEEKLKGDKRYLSHVWDTKKIESGFGRLVTILADHYEQKLNADFEKSLEKLREKQTKAQTFIEDAQRPEAEVAKLLEDFKAELKANEDALPFDAAQYDLEAKNNLERARVKGLPPEQKKDFLAKARAARDAGGKTLADHKAKQAALRSRMNNLNNSQVKYDEKYRSAIDRIQKTEDDQIDTIYRAAKSTKKFLDFLAKGSNKEFTKAIENFKSEFTRVAEIFDRAEERLQKMSIQDAPSAELLQEKRAGKLDVLAEEIDQLESFDRAEWRATVENAAKQLLSAQNDINNARALRMERLKTKALKLTPEEFQAKLDAAKTKHALLEPEFNARFNTIADSFDTKSGKASFRTHAEEMGARTAHKLKGTDRRLAYSDLIREERGPELARVLDISAEKVLDFLETDVEKIANIYTRTLGADISLTRVFGSTNMEEQFLKLTDEETKVQMAVLKAVDKKGVPLTDAAKEKLTNEVSKFYKEARQDIAVLLERTRGIRGIPKDADSWSARAAKTAMELNALRYLGGTVLSSVADPAKNVMKFGLTSVMKDGFVPLITNFKTLKLSMKEAQLAGAALDHVTHSRVHAMTDVFEDAYRGTYLERGITYMNKKMGAITLMDQWNTAMKQFTAGLTNTRLLSDIETVMVGKAGKKELEKSTERLAALNLGPEVIETIWEQVTNGVGGGKVNGIWLPNTDSWDVSKGRVKTARRAYRAALVGNINNTIVTPGLERPNWVDANIPGRLVGQFRSFSLSSTQKTLLAGLQAHDAAFLNGAIISLALGAFSYYLWAVSTGGDAYEKMQNASLGKWADEAITRSGLTGVFDEVQRTAQRIPLLNKYASFAGQRSSRREGGGLVEGVFGPSAGLVNTMAGTVTGMTHRDDNGNLVGPDRNAVHHVRQMLPFQNLFYFRQLLNKIENGIGNVFNLQGKKQ